MLRCFPRTVRSSARWIDSAIKLLDMNSYFQCMSSLLAGSKDILKIKIWIGILSLIPQLLVESYWPWSLKSGLVSCDYEVNLLGSQGKTRNSWECHRMYQAWTKPSFILRLRGWPIISWANFFLPPKYSELICSFETPPRHLLPSPQVRGLSRHEPLPWNALPTRGQFATYR